MLKFGDWINRKRHNRGFGIQSPSAFFFITEVLRERLPYYAYRHLDRSVERRGGMSVKHARELFRITNYMQPCNCISIASDAAGEAMKAARPSVACHTLEGTETEEFAKCIERCGSIGMVYIAECQCRNAILETALRHTGDRSVIVIEGIHKDKATRLWWQGIIENPKTIVTYDMYSYGVLFFDKEKKKQHYKLKR